MLGGGVLGAARVLDRAEMAKVAMASPPSLKPLRHERPFRLTRAARNPMAEI